MHSRFSVASLTRGWSRLQRRTPPLVGDLLSGRGEAGLQEEEGSEQMARTRFFPLCPEITLGLAGGSVASHIKWIHWHSPFKLLFFLATASCFLITFVAHLIVCVGELACLCFQEPSNQSELCYRRWTSVCEIQLLYQTVVAALWM